MRISLTTYQSLLVKQKYTKLAPREAREAVRQHLLASEDNAAIVDGKALWGYPEADTFFVAELSELEEGEPDAEGRALEEALEEVGL